MWVLAADLDGITHFIISGGLGADGEGIADGFTTTIMVGGNNYNLFVKRVRNQPGAIGSDPSVNHLIIIPENTAVTHNFATDTDDDQHQITGLAQTTRLYYLLFASENSGLIDSTTMVSIANSFIATIQTPSGTFIQTAGLPSGSSFPEGTTTNTFLVTDKAGNTTTCSFDVTVNCVQITWTGAVSSDWEDAANWSSATVPTINDDVVIPDAPNDPVITNGQLCTAKSIAIKTSGHLTIQSGGQLNVAMSNFTIELLSQMEIQLGAFLNIN